MKNKIRQLYLRYNNIAIILVVIAVILFWTTLKDAFQSELLNIFGYSISVGLAALIGIGIYLYWPTLRKFF
ncbi:MAG: hypothetical protein U9R08_03740 [Nanoarchaeota archaeon]|nr:hypothetical protein [Nanoarchaeota archaeon]